MGSEQTMNLDRLQEMAWGFAGQRVITVASRTGLLRHLSEQRDTPSSAASALDLDPLATAKVVRALHALGILRAEGESYFVVAGLRPHFRGADDLAPFLEHLHCMYDSWGEKLEPWLRGESWGRLEQPSFEQLRGFGRAMRAMGRHVARQVLGVLDLSSVRRVLDVGGGFGHYSQVLAEAQPELRAVVLDCPGVCAAAREELDSSALGPRIEFRGGDYFEEDYGRDFDLVLLANVLHQERPAQAGLMLRRAARATAPGGRVVVVDFSIDPEQRHQLMGALFAINMRSFGDTHPEAAIRGWLGAAGLEDIQRHDISPFRWVILGRKPGDRT